MICALITRNKDGWEVDAEFFGYGNANIVDAFKMEGIYIQKEMDLDRKNVVENLRRFFYEKEKME